jgi:phosphatidylglycerophosphate synthase
MSCFTRLEIFSMLDALLRKWIDPLLAPVVRWLVRLGLTANRLTVAGFVVGLAGLPDIATRHYWAGLALLAASRLLDVVDGAAARQVGPTHLGRYLDVVLDTIFTACVPFAFALADPPRTLAAMFLLLGLAVRAAATAGHAADEPAFVMKCTAFAGFALACLIPSVFSLVCYVLGILCFAIAGRGIATAVRAP